MKQTTHTEFTSMSNIACYQKLKRENFEKRISQIKTLNIHVYFIFGLHRI